MTSQTVVTAWYVLRLRLEEPLPIRRLAVNILHNQSRTADKEWSYALGFGRDANNSLPKTGFGTKQIIWFPLNPGNFLTK